MVITGKPVNLTMITEKAVYNHRLTEGKSCEETDCNKNSNYNKQPEKANQRQHEPVGHLHLIVQRKDDSYQSVVGESNKIKRLHGKAGEAEKKICQAVIVGDVGMVKQKDVKNLWDQSRAAKQVHKC